MGCVCHNLIIFSNNPTIYNSKFAYLSTEVSYNKEHQHRPTAMLNDTTIPHTHETKILGITYNTSMSFAQHVSNIVTKCRPRLNALRALTGTTFGQHKETLIIVYKQYIRSTIDYSSPAWHPALSNTQLNKLQNTQNTAFRIILGCTQTTPIEHLHTEPRFLQSDYI